MRLPGIWFNPDTTDLHVRFPGTGYKNTGVNSIPIPIGVTSNILINAFGRNVETLVDGNVYRTQERQVLPFSINASKVSTSK
jgi:hypothetical protein